MNKVVVTLLLLISGIMAQAQWEPGYTPTRTKIEALAFFAERTLHVPNGAAPTLNNGSTKPGALFFNISDSTLNVWTGSQWRPSGASSGQYVDTMKVSNDSVYFRRSNVWVFVYKKFSGNYNDLTNKPTITQPVNADWNATTGLAQILNKPTIVSPVNADWNASSGLAQILNKPTIVSPVNADWNASTGLAQILNKPTIPAQVNLTQGSGISISGTYPNLTVSITTHTHSAADITSGILPIARGGTGLSAIGTALQVLRVNAAGNALEYYTPSTGSTYTGSTSIILNGSSFERAALTGDVSAAQNVNSITVNGLKGVALPALTAGLIRYNGTAWVMDNNTYLTAEVDGSTTNELQSLSLGTATTTTQPISISSGNTITLGVATTSLAGLLSASDKTKLDGLSNYSLPIASSTILGGVKVGAGLAIDGTGVLSITTHVHSASDITSGILPVARGGTGMGALGPALQIMRVNSAGTALEYFMPTITAGNITSSSYQIAFIGYGGATIQTFTSTLAGLVPASGGGTTNFLRADGTWAAPPGGGGGTVTSVGLSMPSIFSVSNSPVTSSGTLTAALVSQSANAVFAAPDGAAGTPTFRALVNNDLPVITDAKISSAATWNAKLSNITGLITAGTNVTITGTGGTGNPYVINATGGGSTSPAGSSGQIQINNSGVFGASANFTFTNNALTVNGGFVIGSELYGFVGSGIHRAQIVATGTQTPLVIQGGSGAVEVWSNSAGSTINSFGAAVPGYAATSDFVFAKNTGQGWFETMRIQNGTGNVGINQSSPAYKLDVNGTVRLQNTATSSDYTTYQPVGMTTGGVLARMTGGWPSGGSGVSSIGTINSQTKSANGAVISGTSLVMQTADGVNPGLLTASDYVTFYNKQAALVSGTNIKTINGNSLLGSGDITTGSTGGTYTPTIINESNLSSTTIAIAYYTVSNNIVTVTIQGSTNPAALNTLSQFSITLPYSSVNSYMPGSGTFAENGTEFIPIQILYQTSTYARVQFKPKTYTTSGNFTFTFSYSK